MSKEVDASSHLIELYGEDALDKTLAEIERLKANSNIPFTKAYIQTGISFLLIKCEEIINNQKEKKSLSGLVNESFGEAAICTYNVT